MMIVLAHLFRFWSGCSRPDASGRRGERRSSRELVAASRRHRGLTNHWVSPGSTKQARLGAGGRSRWVWLSGRDALPDVVVGQFLEDRAGFVGFCRRAPELVGEAVVGGELVGVV